MSIGLRALTGRSAAFAIDVAAAGAVRGEGVAGIDTAFGQVEFRLVRDVADHTGLGAGAEQRSLRPLENFDALGKWRATSDGVAVDASASLPDGSRFDGVTGLRALIVSHREDFVRTFADRLLSYAIGRGTELSDGPAVRRIVREAAAQDYRW